METGACEGAPLASTWFIGNNRVSLCAVKNIRITESVRGKGEREGEGRKALEEFSSPALMSVF